MQAELRIDKWLWAARFFRSRSLAQAAIENGRVLLGGQRVKVSRSLRVDDLLSVKIGDQERTVRVRGLDERRGPAPIAQAMYEETPESIARRETQAEARRHFTEPAAAITGRPTKRDRRRLGHLQGSD